MKPFQTFVMMVLILLLSGSTTSLAATTTTQATTESHPIVCPICGRVSNPNADYATKASLTLARGAENTLLGWTELFRQPVDEVKGGGNVVTGIGKGIGQSVTRTLGGLGEVLTFWTPKVQNRYVHFSNDCPICMGKQQPPAR